MSIVLAIRHSHWKYLPDAREQNLSSEGVELAQRLAGKLKGFDRAYSSEYPRAIESAHLLGYPDSRIDPRLNELFCPENFETAAEYTQHMFEHHLDEVRAKADALEAWLLLMPRTSTTLWVSHGVTLAALYVKLQLGEVRWDDWNLVEFDPLTGFYFRMKNGLISVELFKP